MTSPAGTRASRWAPLALRVLAGLVLPTLGAEALSRPVVEEREPNDTPATATPLDVSGGLVIVSGAISTPGNVDYYRFSAPAGARVWAYVDTGGAQNQVGATASRDSLLALFAPDGTTVIEVDDDDGTGNGGDDSVETHRASVIGGRTLPATGTYLLRITEVYFTYTPTDYNYVVDPYRLFLVITTAAPAPEVEPNGTPLQVNPISTPTSRVGLRSGAIGVAGDFDYYSVVARAGDVLFVAADRDPERDGIGTDVVVDLIAPDGVTPLVSADPSGTLSNPAEGFDFHVTRAGTYFVRVSHFSAAGTGTYHLLVAARSVNAITPEVEPNDTPATATRLDAAGRLAIASGAIATIGDHDYYAFTAPAGARVWAYVDTGGAQNLLGLLVDNRDSVLTLFAPDGTTVLEADDDDGTGNGRDDTIESGFTSVIAGRTLPTAGTYYLRVQGFNDSLLIDPYMLFLAVTTQAPVAEVDPHNTEATANPLLSLGQRVGLRSGTAALLFPDYYSVDARAGDLLFLAVDGDPERDGTANDLALGLFAPDGVTALVSANSAGAGAPGNPPAEGFAFRIVTSGRYFVRVSYFGGGTPASYDLLAALSPATHPHATVGAQPGRVQPILVVRSDAPEVDDREAAADFTGDGVPDRVTGAPPGEAPVVRLHDGATGAELAAFLAFAPGQSGGVSVAAGDLTGDGVPDLIAGGGAGGPPLVRVWDGATGAELATFLAFDPGFTGGVSVAACDVNGDGRADLVVGAGPGGGPHVRVWDGATGAELASFFAFEPSYAGGVRVACAESAAEDAGPGARLFDGATGRPLDATPAGPVPSAR